jgi:hypothetical protein
VLVCKHKIGCNKESGTTPAFGIQHNYY